MNGAAEVDGARLPCQEMRLLASRGSRDLFPGATFPTGCRILSEAETRAASLQGQIDDACTSLNWLVGYRLDSGERARAPVPMQLDTIACVDELMKMTQPTPGDDVVYDFKECFKLLLRR